MDAGEEFSDAEGFCDVVVGSEFEAEDLVDLFGFCGDEEDWDAFVSFSDFTAYVVSIHSG